MAVNSELQFEMIAQALKYARLSTIQFLSDDCGNEAYIDYVNHMLVYARDIVTSNHARGIFLLEDVCDKDGKVNPALYPDLPKAAEADTSSSEVVHFGEEVILGCFEYLTYYNSIRLILQGVM